MPHSSPRLHRSLHHNLHPSRHSSLEHMFRNSSELVRALRSLTVGATLFYFATLLFYLFAKGVNLTVGAILFYFATMLFYLFVESS